jgi:hypothetical protein
MYRSFFLQTRKFFIKVLVRNEFVLNVQTLDFKDMGYNLKRDGWLNSFIDVKNQFMRDDGMPWRGAREKRPEFFFIILSALMDKDDIILDWQCDVGSIFTSLFFIPLIFLCFNLFCIWLISHSFPYPHLFALSCSRRFHHCMQLHSTPYCGAWVCTLEFKRFWVDNVVCLRVSIPRG